jgi:DNA polymerase-1
MPPYKYKYSIPSSLSEIDLGTYNCLDVDITKRVQEGQEDDLEQSGQLNLMNSCMKGEHAAMKMRLRGVYVNKDKLVKEFARIRPRVEKLAKEFRELYNCDIASPKQVSELLYHTMNFMIPTRAKRGKSWPSVDEKALTELLTYCIGESKEKKCLDTVIAYREIAKTDSTYLTGIYKQIHSDNRLHPDWIPNGPDTGRWACKAPDLQNVPKWLRRIYTPEGDKVFYAGDYNRLELWIGQILSGDEELGRVLETEDIHGIILEEILRTSNFLQNEVPAQQRLKAKAVVFGGIYGKEAKNLAGELKIPRQVVEAWYEIFYGRFPMLKLFLDKLVSDWKRDGFLKTPFGRIKYCEKDTEAKNFPFQSCAGQVTENAIIALEENGFNTILQVHDQILVEESDDTRFKEFQDIMELSTPMLKKRFPVEAKLGYDWEAVS